MAAGNWTPKRCSWATTPESIRYHDEEWGVPVRDDRTLFEFLVLEGAQAGLSWETILRKRDNYRRLFLGFDPERVARMRAPAIERILLDPGVVRNRAKVESAVGNARAFLRVARRHGTFARFAWDFVGGRPIVNSPRASAQIPAISDESEAMSRALRALGFRFVGPTICYAFMQAVGMVNDHLTSCWRYRRPAGR
jgi:DNA-3-methyladenine glycosylase I